MFLFKCPNGHILLLYLTLRKSALLLGLIPIGTFGYWTLAYPVNVPFLDDFLDSVLSSLVRLKNAPTPAVWWQALTAFYNEHRLVYTRLIALLSCALNEGYVDFRFLLGVGNAALLGLLGLFGLAFRRLALPAWYGLPLPFLVLQTQAFENMLYGMASLQNFSVLLFAALALWALPWPGQWAGALVAAVLASLTSGNGLFVFGAGLPVLWVQRRTRAGVGWGLAGVLMALTYLQGYQPLPTPPTSVLEKLGTFFGLLGAFAGAGRGYWVPVVTGLGLTLVLGALAWPVWQRKRPATPTDLFLWGLLAWVLLTAAAIALNRGGGANTSLSRYKVYPMLVLVLGYLIGLGRLSEARRPPFGALALLGAVGFWTLTQLRMPALLTDHRQALACDVFNWQTSGTTVSPRYAQEHFQPYPYLKRALEAGVYRYPALFFSPFYSALLKPIPPTGPRPLPLSLDSTRQWGYWHLSHASFPVPGGAPDHGVYLLLRSDSVSYLFPTRPNRPRFALGRASYRGFSTVLFPAVLRPGPYQTRLLVYAGGTSVRQIPTGPLLIR
jgi:hypothetical protein